jgi:hypothetical protein
MLNPKGMGSKEMVMYINDAQERAGRLQRPAVLRARVLGLLGRRTALEATLRTQITFQTDLAAILGERNIPQVRDLLERLRQQMHDTSEHLTNVQVALGRHDD